ncbi:hypothetical protein LTS02_012049 [Friedmanniomyces endolithicus]|nr:hypothetical protein LTS02_012049 [Friedmanniomyces endolithicus]
MAIFQPSVLRYLPGIDSHRDYTIPNLLAFETWVATHINQWSDLHKSDANACEQLYDLIERYHDLALRQYLGNPEALSVCYLTVLELWKALVVCATHLYPLLADYRLDLSMAFAQNLLLPSEAEMQCLMALETYFTTRENRAHLPSARCSYAITADCFSVRYFDQYPDLQVLLEKIEVQAAQEKAAKLEELARLKSEYERLMTLHRDTFCQYYEYVSEEANEWMPQAVTEQRHSYSCQKCEYKSKAAGLKIDIHEWPLPVSTTNQKAVVFEMRPPFSFIHWRDSLVFLRINVLQAEYTMGMRARAQHPLSTDEKLARFATGQHRRIGLLSEDKPHTGTHRKTMDISKATDAKICLASGLNYKYYDSDTGTFISGLACTKYHSTARTSSRGDRLRYRSSSIAHLPIRMAGPQILKLASIPSGSSLQWPNILVQLGIPAINFKNAESTVVLFQCIYQAGSASNDVLRVGHAFCGDPNSAAKLLMELGVALRRIEGNWESTQALSVFISIAARLLTLSSSDNIRSACLAYLEGTRVVALDWMSDLSDNAQHVSSEGRSDYMSKRAEVALICIDSLNIDDVPLATVLASSEQASILIQCTITMQESRLLLTASNESTVQLLLLRSQRLLRRCCGALASNSAALNGGVVNSWAGFQSGAPWTAAGFDHWRTTTTTTGTAGATLRVNFNTLTGELLVNGLPLGRLPRKYEDHASYCVLFGQTTNIEVIPSAVPGLQFAAKRLYFGYELHFALSYRGDGTTTDLMVQASKNCKRYELITPELFRATYPAVFSEEYFHWYDIDAGVVEFRLIKGAWSGSGSRTWSLIPDQRTKTWRLTIDSQVLLSLPSTTSKALT